MTADFPSPGMDPATPAPLGASGAVLRLMNAAAAAIVAMIAITAYGLTAYARPQLEKLYGWVGMSFTGAEFLRGATACYLVILAIFYFAERNPTASKSLHCLWVAVRFLRSPLATWRVGLLPRDKLAVLSTLLKGFFAPMMTMSLMSFLMVAIENGMSIARMGGGANMDVVTLFDRYAHYFVLQLILFVDVLVFTIGYLVELPRLRNQIRSVDPTLLGWTAALACYPPFNTFTGKILGSTVSDFPRFDDPTVHVGLNFSLLALMGLYTWASVALGWKASNLTHRGVIARGPYAFIRHPAYVCKNLAWWIASIPLIATGFGDSPLTGAQALASMAGWSLVYVLRALTEEDHLRGVDGEYDAYASKVRYRFIPGVL